MVAPFPKFNRSTAFTLVEVMVAMGIGIFALAGAFMLDSHQLRLVKSSRESGAASLTLEERVEQLRIATWREITDPNFLKDDFFSRVPKSIAPLNGYSEEVTVTAWPDTGVCPPLVVEKKKGSSANVVSSGDGMADQRLAKVDVRVSWIGNSGRPRERSLATVISNGGISRMNLPSMGSAAGQPAAPSDSTPAAGGSTPPENGGAATPPPSTPAPATPSSSTPLPISKKNGRGNVSGKPGKA